MKRVTALTLALIMLISAMPYVSFAAATQSVIDSLGGIVLWSAPDGDFYDAEVEDAFEGWSSDITSGNVNVRKYSTGVTLQYYTSGNTDNVTRVISPGYGDGAEKIIIEWVMKRESPKDLYFDFSFADLNGNEIAFLKLDINAADAGDSHPENDEIYAMGFPSKGDECAIVAYNNPDGETHTADYYVNGEKLYTQDSLDGVINGFKSITSSSGYYTTKWEHIGFSDLTVGIVNKDEESTEEPTEVPTEEVTEEVTEEPTEEVTEEPAEEASRYDVIEDAFVQYNKVYGINTTNSSGLMIGSSADENRGPEYDANGETTYLAGATPTTLGSTRVGLVKFPVIDIEDDERATLKIYARQWHQQGFDGGNTFLRIAATPLSDSSWADQREGSTFTIASEPLLDSWQTPVFSEKCAKEVGYFDIDVTEMMHAAKNADMDYISFKLQIYWGAA